MYRPLALRLELSVLAAIFSASALNTSRAADPKPPNIVFIMADDLGYGHLGCYGQDKIRTPNIDQLAREGLRFTQAYAGCCVCAPSRSTLMTGLHTGHTPVRRNGGGNPLRPEDVTVAELLHQAGYTCGGFGKWGLGDEGTTGVPTRQGFDAFFGYLHQVHAHFYYPYYLMKDEARYLLPENEGERRARYSHDEIAAQAMQFLRDHRDGPFFLYCPFTLCHTELLVPEDSLVEYRGHWPETPHISRGHYAPQDHPRAALAGMITRLDRTVGQIVELTRELGLEENTLIIFTSDNGGQCVDGPDLDFFHANGPLRGAKGELYEGGIREPFIARWTGKIVAGKTSDQSFAFWDMLPTFCELAGVKAPEGIDGISIVPTLLNQGPQPQHNHLYWEQPAGKQLLQAVRMKDYKAVRKRADGPIELYDLAQDIGEKHDLAAEQPDVVAQMREILSSARTPDRGDEPELPRKSKADYVR